MDSIFDGAKERPIAVGDLVQIVRPGCKDESIGITFVADSIGPEGPRTRCMHCCNQHGPAPFAYSKDHDAYVATSRLKRIPPLDELEGVRTEENIKEPA